MHKTLEGLLASVMGAVMGVLIARGIAETLSVGSAGTVLGAVLGGLVGGAMAWLSMDWAGLKRGVQRAWRETVVPYFKKPINVAAVHAQNKVVAGTLGAVAGMMSFVVTFMGGIDAVDFSGLAVDFSGLITLTITATIAVLLFMMASYVLYFILDCFFAIVDESRPVVPDLAFGAILLLPLVGTLAGLIFIPVVVAATLVSVPYIAWIGRRIVGKFLKTAYVYVHTYRRRCAFIGAFVGTVAGTLVGFSVVVGAVVGAVSFLFEYELVAKRFLNVPVRT